jgi:hypothetical protein
VTEGIHVVAERAELSASAQRAESLHGFRRPDVQQHRVRGQKKEWFQKAVNSDQGDEI